MTKKPNTQHLKEFYNLLKQVDLKQWESVALTNVKEFIKEHKLIESTKDNELNNAATFFCIYGKVANSINEDAFVEIFTKNELPALKLNQNEMEALKGGMLFISEVASLLLKAKMKLVAFKRVFNNEDARSFGDDGSGIRR